MNDRVKYVEPSKHGPDYRIGDDGSEWRFVPTNPDVPIIDRSDGSWVMVRPPIPTTDDPGFDEGYEQGANGALVAIRAVIADKSHVPIGDEAIWANTVAAIEALKTKKPDDPEVIYATPIRDDVWAGTTEDGEQVSARIGDLVEFVEVLDDTGQLLIQHPDSHLPHYVLRSGWRICKVLEKNDA